MRLGLSGIVLTALLACNAHAASAVTIVPQPKEVKFVNSPAIAVEKDSTAIVIGAKATEPEKYAAELLQKTVNIRFGQKWPVVKETDSLKPYKTIMLLGQANTNAMVKKLAAEWKADLTDKGLGKDAFAIKMGNSGGRFVALVGGSNDRSVIYGQDTLFQLLQQKTGKISLVQADIHDWASIAWRGRPMTSDSSYLAPNRFDSFSRARLNWIDLRNSATNGQYGYQPGTKIDVDNVKKVVYEAHRRGIFVYATVNCAVWPKDYDDVMRLYKELVALGADGLYISIDDPGAEFRIGTPDELIKRVLALGREHGMTGYKIAIVPGKESYKEVLTDVNKRVAKIPGMESALFFWTVTPCEQELIDARAIGLKSKPAWWHNWPRPKGGFTYADYGGPRRVKGFPYMALPSLADGWGNATYEELAVAGKVLDAVMPWGGTAWGPEYNSNTLGWWAWAPELHNWDDVRNRIYGIVFGPGQAETAKKYDDTLRDLQKLYSVPGRGFSPADNWPPVLLDQKNKQKALDMVAEMQKYLNVLKAKAPKETIEIPEMLEDKYLEPMQATLDIATKLTDIKTPAEWWEQHEKRVITAVRAGNLEQAKAWDDEARDRAVKEAEVVRDALASELQGMDEYVKYWKEKSITIDVVPKVAAAPKINGDLSDPAWQKGFHIQKFSGDPQNQTEMRITFTDTDLYLGFVCHAKNMGGLKLLGKTRDSMVWEDDSVEIFLNTDALGNNIYHFIINANGVLLDANERDGNDEDTSWTSNVELKTAKAADRWTAEIRIPVKDLEVSGSPAGKIWLCNFARNDKAGPFTNLESNDPYEISSWNPAGGLHDPASFRPIEFGR